MTEPHSTAPPWNENRQGTAVRIAILCLIGLLASFLWTHFAPSVVAQIIYCVFQVAMISIVIWQACDPFADAAQYFGERWRIPGSVRGATLDAVASSLPELFTGLFFVLIALGVGTGEPFEQPVSHQGDGFGATIATCAGSAVYNMILIPAFCGIAIAKTRLNRPVIEIERSVITRDGLWFLACEIVLIAFLFQKELSWHLAAILIAMYGFYLGWLWIDAQRYRRARAAAVTELSKTTNPDDDQIQSALAREGIKASPNLVEFVRRELKKNRPSPEQQASDEDEDDTDTAGLLFGNIDVPLTAPRGYGILGISTLITAVACFWLVNVTQSIAETLSIPVFFVAVIVAAAASSVPDTLLSIAAARRGDDDGAVSNAFGSNIFDICICLSVPLLAGIYFNGGNPISLTVGGEAMPGLFGLQVLLLSMTAITLATLWLGLRLTLTKAYFLVGLYLVFISYAVIGSLTS